MLTTLSLGPPPVPLPRRWWLGLSRRQVHRVISTELRGAPRVAPARAEKGYVYLYLGRGHPYARKGGTQTLHRYLVLRERGGELKPYEHVHHRHAADKETTELVTLEIRDAVEHGLYHYHRHFRRTAFGWLEWVGCGEEHAEGELGRMADSEGDSAPRDTEDL